MVLTVTLLLSVITPHYAMQASDRRVTYIRDGKIAGRDDERNKAIFVAERFTFAITGAADIDGGHRRVRSGTNRAQSGRGSHATRRAASGGRDVRAAPRAERQPRERPAGSHRRRLDRRPPSPTVAADRVGLQQHEQGRHLGA